MGLILDSSVLITAEREGQNARQMLAAVSAKAGNTEIAISVVTLIELAHGAARAGTPERKAKRQRFIQELLMALPIHPVSVPTMHSSSQHFTRPGKICFAAGAPSSRPFCDANLG